MSVIAEEYVTLFGADESDYKRGIAAIAAANLSVAASVSDLSKKFEDAFKKVPAAIDPVKSAFSELKVKSTASLEATAASAQKAFDTIKNSGTASISDINAAWNAKSKIIDESVGSWTGSLSRFGDSLSSVGQKMTVGITLPLLAVGGASIKMASDFDESLNKTRVVFGASSAAIEEFSKTAASGLGLSSQKALESSASFGNLFKTMGVATPAAADMSVKMVKLASDLASFHNIRPEDALEKLRSGLVGEAEPMRTLGVLINETTVKSKAMSMGFKEVGGNLTEQQKVMARYQLILDQTKISQGDFSRTSTGVANSSRIIQAQFQDLSASIGQQLLPIALQLGARLKELLGWFNNLSPATKQTIVTIGGIAAVAGPAIFILGKLASGVSVVWSATAKMIAIGPTLISSLNSSTIALYAARAGWFALAAAAVWAVAELIRQYREAGSIGKMISNSFNAVNDIADNLKKKAHIGEMGPFLSDEGNTALEAERSMAATMKAAEDAVTKATPALKKAGGGAGKGMAKALVDEFSDGLTGLGAAIARVNSSDLSVLFDKLSKGAKAGAEQAKAALKTVVAAVNEYLQAMGGAAKTNEAQFANMDKPAAASLTRQTLAYKTAHAEIDRILVESAAHQTVYVNITQSAFDKMNKAAAFAFNFLGGLYRVIQNVPPAIKDFSATTAEESAVASKAIADMASSSQKSFDAYIAGIDKVGHAFSPVVVAAQLAADKLKEALASSDTLALLKAQDDVRQSLSSTVETLYKYGEAAGNTGKALDDFVTGALSKMTGLTEEQRAALAKLVEIHKSAAIQLPGIWESIFSQVSAKVKGFVGGAIGLIETLPGKFGDVGRSVLKTVELWSQFASQVLKVLHGLNSSIPATLGDLLKGVTSIFKGPGGYTEIVKGSASAVNAALDYMGFSAAKSTGKVASGAKAMGNTGKEAFSAMAGAAASFTTALGVTAATGSKTMGIVSSLFTSTLAGIQAGMAFGPVGGAVVGGISLIGGILGSLFGGGKSAAQKEQERIAAEKAKIDMQAAAQGVINAAIEGFDKALEFFDHLDDFTKVRRKKFDKFFANLKTMMDHFVALAKSWGTDSLTQAKALGEALGPVVEAIGNSVNAIDGIGKFIAPAASIVDSFFASLTLVFTKFGELAESTTNHFEKQVKKFGERMAPGIALMKDGVEGMSALLTFKPVTSESIDIFAASLEMAMLKIGELAETIDLKLAKHAAKFAERAGAVTGLLKDGVDGLMAIATMTPIPEGAFDLFFSGIQVALERMVLLAENLDTEFLGRATTIAQAVIPISAAFKAWGDASTVIRNYTAIAASSWQAAVDDFAIGLEWLDSLMVQALSYLAKATLFNTTVTAGNVQLGEGINGFVAAASGAFTSLNNAFGQIQGGVSGGEGSLGAQSLGTFSSNSVSNSPTVVQENHFHFHAPAGSQSAIQDMVIQALTGANARLRNV